MIHTLGRRLKAKSTQPRNADNSAETFSFLESPSAYLYNMQICARANVPPFGTFLIEKCTNAKNNKVLNE
jgi:hypothetical protein